MSTLTGHTYLDFDDRDFYGSPEHFFHFMWGYLLPAVGSTSGQSRPKTPEGEKDVLCIRSCGPVMDSVWQEVLTLCGHRYEILERSEFEARQEPGNTILLPRWDIWLRNLDVQRTGWMRLAREIARLHISVNRTLASQVFNTSRFVDSFRSDVLRAKDYLEARVGAGGPAAERNGYADHLLLLQRSPPPEYYRAGGGSHLPGYGTSRRALAGTDEVVRVLNERGIPVKMFEPGKHTMQDQIAVFRSSRGIIGIKGAEFANMIWLRPRTLVLQVRPSEMKTLNPQKQLADLLDLEYAEIVTAEGSNPSLDPERVFQIVEGQGGSLAAMNRRRIRNLS